MSTGSDAIVSWVRVHEYPIERELVYFVSFVVLLPLLAYLLLSRCRLPKPVAFEAFSYRGGDAESRIQRLIRWLVLPLVLYVLLFDGRINGFADFYHEGERLVPLQVALHGGLPYRDAHLQHGLGQNFVLPMVAAKVFEPTLEGVRKLQRVLDPLAYVVVYFFGLLLYRNAASVSLFLVLTVSSAGYWVALRQGLGLLSFTLLLAAIEFPTWRRLALLSAGAIGALAFWFSVEIGVYTVCAGVVWLLLVAVWTRKRVGISWYLGGVVFVSAPILVWLQVLGVLGDAAANLHRQVTTQLIVWGLPFPSPSAAFAALSAEGIAAADVKMYLPILSYVLAGGWLAWRLAKGGDAASRTVRIALLYLAGCLFFRTALGRSDYGHWIDGSTPWWPLLLLVIDASMTSAGAALLKRRRPAKREVLVICLGGAVLLLAFEVHAPLQLDRFSRVGLEWRGASAEEMLPNAGHARLPSDQVERARQVLACIESFAGSEHGFYDFSNQGAYYFFSGRLPPSRYFQSVYAATPSEQQQVIDDIERAAVSVVLLESGSPFDRIDGVENAERAAVLYSYLARSFPGRRKCGDATIRFR
ncbi:MAG: hypothetical protein KDD69_17215 [Bdellovibrionales bacterium]|nr:hypothetical protein [Bdellovibrionales bacterium]